MLRNYLSLQRTYKRITHTKKVEEGDWILVLRKRSRHSPLTALIGQVYDWTKSGSVDLLISGDDVWKGDQSSIEQVKGLNENTVMFQKLDEDGVRCYQWRREWAFLKDAERPILNKGIVLYVALHL